MNYPEPGERCISVYKGWDVACFGGHHQTPWTTAGPEEAVGKGRREKQSHSGPPVPRPYPPILGRRLGIRPSPPLNSFHPPSNRAN